MAIARWIAVPAFAALIAGASSAQQYIIDFDGLGNAATVPSSQYPEAVFQAIDPTNEVRTYAVRLGSSPPNLICTAVDGTITCREPMSVDFPTPVQNLTFFAVGANKKGRIADARVFVNGTLAGTVQILGAGKPKVPVLVDLTSFKDVTRIELDRVDDPYGVGWDDFSFEIQQAPVFEAPTPCATTIVAQVGTPVSFQVVASDLNASDQLMLDATGIPAAAQLTPTLPAVGNPVSTDFTWTPSVNALGVHTLTFQVTDGQTQPVTCTITLDVQCPGSGVNFGTGIAGSGGYTPQISITCPVVGQPVQVDVVDGPGGALGCLLMGPDATAMPFRGGTMYVDPNTGYSHTHVLTGTNPGEGTFTYPLTVPADPSLTGTNFYIQAGYIDPGAIQGVAATDAIEITIG